MKKILFLAILLAFSSQIRAQISSTYEISFENAVHHEAEIQATFTNLKENVSTLPKKQTEAFLKEHLLKFFQALKSN